MLNPKIAATLLDLRQKLAVEGKLLTAHQLADYYDTFQQRFGPGRLSQLDGRELLETMHGHGTQDSLVYWLEFKNDCEFPSPRFGSIAGGSALKFGIYRSSATGEWTTGSPQKQVEISEHEAIQIARQHRDQLLSGCEMLDSLQPDGSDYEYQRIQNALITIAPNVEDSAWGHKYFSLMYPDKLDDFHSVHYQNYHLMRLLLHPPAEYGRYLAAASLVGAARELDMPTQIFGSLMNEQHGSPCSYWRVGTSDRDQPRNKWLMMQQNNVAAIGWPKLGNLSPELHDDLKQDVYSGLQQHYPNTNTVLGKWTKQIFDFITRMREGDIVVASDGMNVLGIGRIKGAYRFDKDYEFAHQRQVEWLSFDEWQMPESKEGLLTTVKQLLKYDNLFALEEHIFDKLRPKPTATDKSLGDDALVPLPLPLPPLQKIPARIDIALERKRQVILYGPPGTGKTYWAEIAACEMAARKAFGKTFETLPPAEKLVVTGDAQNNGLVRLCCFHPAYGYEDFLEGYRPRSLDGQMLFELQDGIFKRLCRDAQANPHLNYYLIVDEINRGDIPRIFGELLTILEKNKRGKAVMLPVSKTPFAVPENVYVIGTMNTADRSIALLDAALRRRFGFIELMPDSTTLGNCVLEGIPLAAWLDALNARICAYVGRDARNLQIGHSYFLESGRPLRDFAHLRRVLREDIVPLLEEYCYEDYSALEKILGSGLVDAERQLIREELFETTRQDELIQSLLATCPEILTTARTVMLEEAAILETSSEDDAADTQDDETLESNAE